MIDLRQSRRNKFKHCEYWSHIENPDIAKLNELAYEKSPNGFFTASIVGNYTEENQVLEGSLIHEKVTVVIETTDNVRELKRNDIVKMDNKFYRVNDINRTPVAKQERYLNDEYVSYTTYISLRR